MGQPATAIPTFEELYIAGPTLSWTFGSEAALDLGRSSSGGAFLGPEARKLTEYGLEELLADLYDAGMHASDAREGSPRQSARCSRGTKR